MTVLLTRPNMKCDLNFWVVLLVKFFKNVRGHITALLFLKAIILSRRTLNYETEAEVDSNASFTVSGAEAVRVQSSSTWPLCFQTGSVSRTQLNRAVYNAIQTSIIISVIFSSALLRTLCAMCFD